MPRRSSSSTSRAAIPSTSSPSAGSSSSRAFTVAEGSGAQFESPLHHRHRHPHRQRRSHLTPFQAWLATNYPLLVAPDNDPGDDPDNDGATNFEEFAFSGNPTSGSDQGARRVAIDDVAGTDHLTLTLALRTGATFTGSGPHDRDDRRHRLHRPRLDRSGRLHRRPSSEIAAITTGLPPVATGLRPTGPSASPDSGQRGTEGLPASPSPRRTYPERPPPDAPT